MKKIQFILTALVCLTFLSACDEEKIITADQLPAAARQYVEKSYPAVGITYAKKDAELFSTKYKVRLNNGLEIEFDKDGVPVDIDTDD